MRTTVPFTKASGAGNDFVLLDGRKEGSLPADRSALARSLCSRHFGVGGDGLLVLLPSDRADFRMEYYNADGSHGGMCGNGGRCIARYAMARGIAGSHLRFEALGHVYEAVAEGELVRLMMKDPSDLHPAAIPHLLEGTETAWFVDTGSPHAVVFAPDVEGIDLTGRGRRVRLDPAFAPEGTNVNFVHVQSSSSLRMRTYERGVEAETLACGTGSVASAVAAWKAGLVIPPVSVVTSGGETLLVGFRTESGAVTAVSLTGSAHLLFEGTVPYDDQTGRVGEA